MSETWRVIDTGLQPAAQNIALSRALLEARRADEIPSTLRFLRYTPSALLGFLHSAQQEFNSEYCAAHEIATQRRMTAGAASYTDATQFDWELYVHQRDLKAGDMRSAVRRICHAVATAASAFGVNAYMNLAHDIDVDGRQLGVSSVVADGDALSVQGTLFIDLDIECLSQVMRLPLPGKSNAAAGEMRKRIVVLRDLVGRRIDRALARRYFLEVFESEFSVELHEGDLTLSEHERYRAAFAAVEQPDWVRLVDHPASDMPVYEAQHATPAGVVTASLVYDRPRHRIRQIWFDTDVAFGPQRCLRDLEAVLRETSVERLDHNVRKFFAESRTTVSGLTPEDFVAVVRLAAKQPLLASNR